jgi:hypothetical protein
MRIILIIVVLLLPVLASGATPPDVALEARLDRESAPPAPEHGKAFTGDATPVEPGRVEVEIAYAPTWWATAGAVDRLAGEQHPVAASVGVGIVPDVDLRIVVGWAFVQAAPLAPGAPTTGNGVADTTVAARWRFLSLAEPSIDLAVSAGITVPTGTRSSAERIGTSREAWSVGGSLLASADWGRVTAGAEVGFSAPLGLRTSNDVGLLVCNAALGYQLLPWLQPEVEVNYQHEIELGDERDERVLWATAALVLPVDAVRVVVGGRIPVWSRDAAVGPTVTAAVKFGF